MANSNSTEDDINIAKQWYTLDENALPSVYVLRNLERIDDETYWKVVLPTLTRLFDGIPFDQSCWKLLTNRSVTEWEVTAAAESEPDKSRLFWMRRTFQGGVTKEYPRYWDYSDVLDDELKASRLSSLLKWMEEKVFLSEQIYNYSDASIKSYCSDDDIWKVQKERWTKEMTSILKNSLDLIIKTGKEWLKNSCGLDIPGEEATEMLHHCAWAARKAADFVGRDELVDSLLNSIATNNRILPSDLQDSDGFDGVSVCVVGRSGCGKTALMAKVADLLSMQQQLEADEDEDFIRPIIIRFCGTSPGSSTGLSMVRSICRQIHFCLGDNLNETAKDVLSMSYNEVVSYFHDLLRDNVVVLFIDSIDQLSNADLARSNVSFLDGVIPHQDTRIIVSVLPDEKDPGILFAIVIIRKF